MPVQTQCSYGDPDGLEFALDGRMYELEYQVVDGDMDPPEYALAGSDLTTQGNTAMLCFVSSSIKFISSHKVNFSVHLQSLASKIFSARKLVRPLANSFQMFGRHG